MPDPNGLCFSPDYKKLYVVSTGKGPGDTDAGGKGEMYVFDVGADNKLIQRQALQRLHGRRREVRARRRARRRGRQSLVLEQRRPQRGLQRGDGVDAAGPSSSGASGCPRSAATSASAAPSATACSWPPASRSTRSTPPRRAPPPVNRGGVRSYIPTFPRATYSTGAMKMLECKT